MGYGLVRLPLWAVGVFAGVVWGLGMLSLPQFRDSPGSLGILLVGAAGFGTVMALSARRQRRRLFTVEGRALSGRERVAVVRAVHLGRPLPDGELRVAARRYAERLRAQPARWQLTVGVFVAAMALGTWLALSDSPWWWLAVAVWPGFGALSVWHDRRQRTAVHRYLTDPDLPPR